MEEDLETEASESGSSVNPDDIRENNFNNDPLLRLPDGVLIKVFKYLKVHDLKQMSCVNRRWKNLSLSRPLLPSQTLFRVDGRIVDSDGEKLQRFIHDSLSNFQLYSGLRLLKSYYKQLSWINHNITSNITYLELSNSSINWANILKILIEFDNLNTYRDVQDMYCWDYSTFSEGLDNERLEDNASYSTIDQSRLYTLNNLKHVTIHRSQITDCSTYLQMLLLNCRSIEHLFITSDQGLNPRPTNSFYRNLQELLTANASTLKTLWFPYKSIYPIYEFRIADDHHPFRDFLQFITDNRWAENIHPSQLTELSIQFPVIHIKEIIFRERLFPLLASWTTLRTLKINCLFLEEGKEGIVSQCIPRHIRNPILGVWWGDSTGVVPNISELKEYFRTVTIQTWRLSLGVQLKEFIPLYDPEDETNDLPASPYSSQDQIYQYPNLREFQFFNKSPNFRFFNVDLITSTFPYLTHLNLVDHNTRVDRVHTSEAPATIENEDLQLIIKGLRQLEFLQLIGNMTFLTDSGLTGLTLQACKRMNKRNVYIKMPGDMESEGVPLSNIKVLRQIILRGVGIKITDVSAYFGFIDMPNLRKLHIYGSQLITLNGRAHLQHGHLLSSKGCDIQV